MGEVLSVMVDIDRHGALAERLGVDGVPALVVLAPDGRTVLARSVGEALARPEVLLPIVAQAFLVRPRAHIPRSTSAIVIDGESDEVAWTTAGEIGPLVREDGNGPSQAETRLFALVQNDALYVSGSCAESNPDGIVAQATADDDEQVWKDDCLEFFIEPRKGSGEEIHLVVSASGHRFDSRNGDTSWNGEWTVVVRRQATTGWRAEVRIPWTSLGLTGSPLDGAEIGFNIGRTRNADGEGSQWSLTGTGGSHQPLRFGTLVVP